MCVCDGDGDGHGHFLFIEVLTACTLCTWFTTIYTTRERQHRKLKKSQSKVTKKSVNTYAIGPGGDERALAGVPNGPLRKRSLRHARQRHPDHPEDRTADDPHAGTAGR